MSYNKKVNYNNELNSLIGVDKGYSGDMTIVTVGDLKLYFSYSTIVAYKLRSELVISENIWSMTTGKHLNWIDENKNKRIKNDKFEAKLRTVLENKNLTRSDL